MKNKKDESPAKFIGPFGAIKGVLGGAGDVLANRRAAKAAGQDYSFGQGLGDFVQGGISGIVGVGPTVNRAGTPDRSLNNMQQMGSIVDPGMQSSQQADEFQKFNSIAQNMPPSPTQMKSPVNNYADPGTAQTIDNSLGAAEGVLAAQRAALMADDEEDEEDGDRKKINKDQIVKLDSGETFKKTPKKSTKIYMR